MFSYESESDVICSFTTFVYNFCLQLFRYVREKKDALDAISVLFTYVGVPGRAPWFEPALATARALRGKMVHPALIRSALACEVNACDAM